jgi:hypothetical protein
MFLPPGAFVSLADCIMWIQFRSTTEMLMSRMNSVAWPTPPRNRRQCTVINSAAICLLCLCQGWPNLLKIGSEKRRGLDGARVFSTGFPCSGFLLCLIQLQKQGLIFASRVAPKIQESHTYCSCDIVWIRLVYTIWVIQKCELCLS